MPTDWNVLPHNATLQGVKVYVGPASRTYNQEMNVGYTTQAYASIPNDGQVYYFAAKSYGYDNETMESVESPYSNEMNTTQATDPKD
jgi:hypothetical protein